MAFIVSDYEPKKVKLTKPAPKHKFQVGDKVTVTGGNWNLGQIGIIKGWYKGNMSTFKGLASVEFKKFNSGESPHSCYGDIPSGKGLWINPANLELCPETNPSIYFFIAGWEWTPDIAKNLECDMDTAIQLLS